jgi:hypothetical protein
MLNISGAELDALAEFDVWGDDILCRDDNDEPMPFDDYDPWEMISEH